MTITEATDTKLLTADDLLRLYSEGVKGELIRGVLQKTVASGLEHGEILVRLGAALGSFVKPKKLGTLVAGTGFWLERDPDTVRKADIAFASAKKIPLDACIPGYAEVAPDLVIEIHSFNESLREVHDKARMWLSHGVNLVWAVYPDTRTVDVHRPDQPVATVTDDGTLDAADVLPGFTCPLTSIFDP